MKKWVILASIPILFIGVFFLYVYVQAQGPYKKAEKQAIALAKDKAAISSVTDFYIYNSQHTYYTVLGKDDKQRAKVVWIPKDRKQKVVIKKASDGISEKEALKKLESEKKPKKVLSARLGMEKVGPVWELTYLDSDDDINYYYVLFTNGEWWKKIENI